MENYSNYSSYPDSRDSSPRSRDCDSASWDEPQQQQQQQQQQSHKAKFMCSYGGKIQPRPHDNQLAYIGGDTKILSVDRSAKFPAFIARLSSIWAAGGADLCFKYQLPGEDLDALISVTNDEDLDHMMIEYDRLLRSSSPKPARLRLFLFPSPAATQPPPPPENTSSSSSDRQWFVDALNSVQIQQPPPGLPDASSSPPAPPPQPPQPTTQNYPDFLFGFDKAAAAVAAAPPPAPPQQQQHQQPSSTAVVSDQAAVSESGSEEQSAAEIQRQTLELQRQQNAAQEQVFLQRKYEDVGNPRGFPAGGGEYYTQSVRVSEKLAEPAPLQPPPQLNVPPTPMPMQVPMQVPTSYVSERHMPAGGYHIPPTGAGIGGNPMAPPQPQSGIEQPPVYLIHTPGGVYHQAAAPMRPMGGPMGQPFYGVHPRAVPEAVYREAAAGSGQMYSTAPNQGIPMMQAPPPSVQKAEQQGFAQVGFDSTGRQVYYTTMATNTAYQNVGPAVSGGTGVGGGGVNQSSAM